MTIFNLTYEAENNLAKGTIDTGFLVYSTDVKAAKLYAAESNYTANVHDTIAFADGTTNANGVLLTNGPEYGELVNNIQIVISGTTYTAERLSANIDTKMGASYYEENLTTGVKKYFSEAFSFDANNFEMDGDRVVGLKQTFIDSLATDLTNIVNTSIQTATLTATNATINNTLTALGIDVTNLVAESVKTKQLGLIDELGVEHKVHLGN